MTGQTANAVPVTRAHTERETLRVEVNIPEHAARAVTPIFHRTRALLIEREDGRCWICGRTEAEAGPLEAHHHPIERCLAEMIDWQRFAIDARAGEWGKYAQAFDWAHFDPERWESFVDDMTVNGRLLCRNHHTVSDEGIHTLPFPLWVAQRYGKEGYRFSGSLIIHHST